MPNAERSVLPAVIDEPGRDATTPVAFCALENTGTAARRGNSRTLAIAKALFLVPRRIQERREATAMSLPG